MKTLLTITFFLFVVLIASLIWALEAYEREQRLQEDKIQQEAETLWVGPTDMIYVINPNNDTIAIKHNPGFNSIIRVNPCEFL